MAKVFACGDVVNYRNTDGIVCSAELQKVIESADYAVCNFEAPIKGHGTPQPKSGPHHSQQGRTLEGLKKQGFDLVLLANNHMLDYGADGLVATWDAAKTAGLDTVGAGLSKSEAYEPLVKDIEGLKVGIINACEAQFGVLDYFEREDCAGYAWLNHAQVDKNIIKLKEQCDFVLLFAHAGLENFDIPQKEWRERYKHFCDLGVDVVVGAHPHVPQGWERYNSSLIFYSLGNFYFDGGRWADKESQSFAVMLDLKKGEVPQFTPIFHFTEKQKVTIAPDSKRVDITSLCEMLGSSYQQKHDEMTTTAFLGVKTNLVRALSPIPVGHSFKSTIKEILATLLGRRRGVSKELLSLHMLRNEAYYYVARHALELQARKKHTDE